jgi:hypothetical protein
MREFFKNKLVRVCLVAAVSILLVVLPVALDVWWVPTDSHGHPLRCVKSHEEYYYPPASRVIVCDMYASPSPT